jgi:hypothetical protein
VIWGPFAFAVVMGAVISLVIWFVFFPPGRDADDE